MGKRRAKKAPKAKVNPANKEKIQKLIDLKNMLLGSCRDYNLFLNDQCEKICGNISRVYADKLKLVPAEMRNMTVREQIAMQEKEKQRYTECPRNENLVRMQHERARIMSEQKKTAPQRRRDRSISASVLHRAPSLMKSSQRVGALLRTPSENSLCTPSSKLYRQPAFAVTPKFDPKLPCASARKARPGETLMALTGSPVSIADNKGSNVSLVCEKGKLSINLGQGKVISLSEDPSNVIDGLDEPLKATLVSIKEHLTKILK